jgi:hypothetical protein
MSEEFRIVLLSGAFGVIFFLIGLNVGEAATHNYYTRDGCLEEQRGPLAQCKFETRYCDIKRTACYDFLNDLGIEYYTEYKANFGLPTPHTEIKHFLTEEEAKKWSGE